MIDKNKLIKGNFYFKLYFNTPTTYIPEIRTIVYLGTNIYSKKHKNKKDKYYFQDLASYQKYANFKKNKRSSSKIFCLNEAQLVMIFDLNGLINKLKDLKKKISSSKNINLETIYIPYSKLNKLKLTK